jgi:hypothetical protein
MPKKPRPLQIRRIPITDPERAAARAKASAAAVDQLAAMLLARVVRELLAADATPEGDGGDAHGQP